MSLQSFKILTAVFSLGCFLLFNGCAKLNPFNDESDVKANEGEACGKISDCATALVCTGLGTCQYPGVPGTKAVGEVCASSKDCIIEYICGSSGVCAKTGSGQAGEACQAIEACAQGLVCAASRKCVEPGGPGTKGATEQCEGNTDCAFGLACINQTCAIIPYWAGATCAEDTGPFRVYFEIPRAAKKLVDFYRLPFPNDIRKKNGFVDVSEHPTPAMALPEPYNKIGDSYLKAIGESVTGFGVNTAIYFRFSSSPSMGSLSVGGTSPTIQFINIDKKSAGYGTGPGMSFFATTERSKYICNNSIQIKPNTGHPLDANTTFAVILRKGIKNDAGADVAIDADFQKVISTTAPTDAEELAAWTAYKPLRDYIIDKKLDPSLIVNAAVFTTMDPKAHMAKFREAVRAEPVPVATSLTLCNGNNPSPCADANDSSRICPSTPDAPFDEIQGLYKTPVYQAGSAPYGSEGGKISYNGSGLPIKERDENSCFALTVPKVTGITMPTAGWPVIIYAHGTGGNFRSFVADGTAKALSAIKDSTGKVVTYAAVISIDASMHGPRRNSTEPPDGLFFNLLNPYAARDNVYQGAADKFQVVRLVQSLNLTATSSPTGKVIRFDPNKIYFFGHSQGTVEGIPFAAFEPDLKAVSLSGAGGYLTLSMIDKTKPINISSLVRMAFADSNVGTMHPLLNLLQLYFEEVDNLNYGRVLLTGPISTIGPKHTYFSWGVADSYTPPSTIGTLATAMGIRQMRQDAQRCGDLVCNGSESCKTCPSDCNACPTGAECGNSYCEKDKGETCTNCQEDCQACPDAYPLDDPSVSPFKEAGGIKENMSLSGKKVTAAMVKYVSDGTYDDHFVVFKNPTAQLQCQNFLGTAIRDTSPTIVKGN